MNIDDVKAVIAQGRNAATAAQATLAEATLAEVGDRIEDAGRLVAVTHDSQHDMVKLGRVQLNEARTEARRGYELLGSAVRAADEFGRALG